MRRKEKAKEVAVGFMDCKEKAKEVAVGFMD